jgi:hypothetical protein
MQFDKRIEWSYFLATNPEVPGSIPGAIRSEKVASLQQGPPGLVMKIEVLLE